MSSPTGVYCDGTRLYVADTGNNRILVFNSLPSVFDASADFALGQPDLNSNTLNNGGISGSSLAGPSSVTGDGSTFLWVADQGNHRILQWNALPTTNGEAASLALGQADLISAAFATTSTTFYLPYGVFWDGSHLLVSDSSNNRVLFWNSIPVSSGQAADHELGQFDFMTAGAGPSYMAAPSQVSSDGTHLFVADTGNHRVTIWNTFPTVDGQAPNAVYGQPSLITNTSDYTAPSRTNLRFPVHTFSDGTHLFVADLNNNRVLIWNSLPTSDNQQADVVLGQPNFTSNTANNGGISGSSLWNPYGVYSDGTRLYVADTVNNRVLVWNTIPTVNGQSADFALGQPNFTTSTPSTLPDHLFNPYRVYSSGTKLFVADASSHRVLVWNTLPTTFAEPASFALGQPDLVSGLANQGGAVSGSTLYVPTDIYSNGSKLFVADTLNHRILVWNSMPTTTGQSANFALGQPDLISGSSNNGGVTGSSLNFPYSVFSDGIRLLVSDYGNQRVLGWNSLPTSNSQVADFVLGQSLFTTNTSVAGQVNGTSFHGPFSSYSDGTKVYITDAGNHRIIVLPIPGI
jgi:hypothetical protein